MKIEEHKSWYDDEPSYTITLEGELSSWEIAECFKLQYPKSKAVIKTSWKKSNGEYCIGIILVGLNLGGKK